MSCPVAAPTPAGRDLDRLRRVVAFLQVALTVAVTVAVLVQRGAIRHPGAPTLYALAAGAGIVAVITVEWVPSLRRVPTIVFSAIVALSVLGLVADPVYSDLAPF